MTLRLRCIRCGEFHEINVFEEKMAEICAACFSKGADILFAPGPRFRQQQRFLRWCGRWQKGMTRHPTHKALTAALDALENTPPGTLDTSSA